MTHTIMIAGLIVALALFFDFTNGFHDSANQVATVITSRALSPETALILAASANFIGAYFFGTAVAETIGKGIVDPSKIIGMSGSVVIISALAGAIIWNFATWHFGIPSSSSHALIGGLIGAFLCGWGTQPIAWSKVGHIILIMIISPIVGLAVTYVFTKLTLSFSRWTTPSANRVFQKLQIVTLITQALAHGTNDAQKTMGVVTFALVMLGLYKPSGDVLSVPNWVIISCAIAIAIGTSTGGWKIIKTLGAGLYRIRPIHGFASQTASTLIIFITAVFGFPISTTQVISSSVMGAGAAFRPKMVRWAVAQDMIFTWLITIPASGIISGIVYFIITKILSLLG